MSLWLATGSGLQAVPTGPRGGHVGRLLSAGRVAQGEVRTDPLEEAGLAARKIATWRAFWDPDRRFDGNHGKHDKHEHKWLVLDAVRSFAPEEAQQALLASGAAAGAVPPVAPPPPPAPLIANQAFIGPPIAQSLSSIGGLSRLIILPPVPESRLDSLFTIPLPKNDSGGGGGGGGDTIVTPPGGGGGGEEVPPLVIPEPPIVIQLAMLSMLAGLSRWPRPA